MKTYGLYKGKELIVTVNDPSCNMAVLKIKKLLYQTLNPLITVEVHRCKEQNC